MCSVGEVGMRGIRDGAVAQLEERLICIQQVIGSNPFGSTIRGLIAQLVRAHA